MGPKFNHRIHLNITMPSTHAGRCFLHISFCAFMLCLRLSQKVRCGIFHLSNHATAQGVLNLGFLDLGSGL